MAPKWLLKSWHERIVVSSDGVTIATVVSDADKHLVAAAPDLLALAKRYASECGECAGVGVTPDDEPCDECKFIRDVIARTGEPVVEVAIAGAPEPAPTGERISTERLVDALTGAEFDCGEWDRNDSDERYDDVHARAVAARSALARRIDQLERAGGALRSLLIRLEVLGFGDEHAPVSGADLADEIAAILPELTDALVEREA